MMYYCYLDTCVFAEILKQYQFSSPNSLFGEQGFLTENMLRRINPIISSKGDIGLIVTSSFTIIEIINKFDEIFEGSAFQLPSLHNFLLQLPEWIIIDELDINTSRSLISIPISDNDSKRVSGDDAIHLAVAMTRKDLLYFCTSDQLLNNLVVDNIHFIA